MEEFYTAAEAKRVLGMAHATFFREVKAGNIPQIGRGKYPKDFIDALASARQMVTEHMKYLGVPHYDFSKSTPTQQEEEMQIGITCFGTEFITPLNLRLAFQLKNPYTFWSLKVFDPPTGRYRVAGYVSLFRFSGEFLDAILVGTHIEIDITLDEVLRFEKGVPFDLYIDVLAMNPALPEDLRGWYLWAMIKRFCNELLNLRSNGYLIRTLYTVTTTPEGDRLVGLLGFQSMKGKSQAKGRLAYRFDLDEAGIARLEELSRRGE